MSVNALTQLYNKRAAHAKSIRDNKDLSHQIIGEQLYSTQSHFIFELLQNAEDENATIVRINYNESRFSLEHNGKLFDIKDIEAITSFGNNERKKLKPNAIGRFGIGFKSVFSITDRPEIKSGLYHFTISNYIVPNLLKSDRESKTVITLPYKKAHAAEIFNKIEKGLADLDSKSLLFLNSVKSIEIKNSISNVSRKISVKRTSYKEASFKILHISQNDDEPVQYLLFEKNLAVGGKKLPIKMAFNVRKKRNKIDFIPLTTSPLFAFFPTEKETDLPFYIHAPFLTTPARDNIQSDNIKNLKLFEGLHGLMDFAINEIKSFSLLDLNTWLVLPCNAAIANEIYRPFCTSFLHYLHNKNHILPTADNKFCHVNAAMFGKNPELQILLNSKEVASLFGRTEWIAPEIDEQRFSTVRDCLRVQFKVPSIGLRELCERADNKFFAAKNDAWMLKFYQQISDHSELWRSQRKNENAGPLRTKTFIRTSLNKTINPFDVNGNLNVYLPTEGNSNYQFVKAIFTQDRESRRLFRSLGLMKPDIIAEVQEHVIPRVSTAQGPYKWYKEDVQKIFRALKKAEPLDEKLLIGKLKMVSWLPGKNGLTKSIHLKKPDELYYPSRELKSFLKTSNAPFFLDLSFLGENSSKPYERGIFEELGIFFRPRRYYREGNSLLFEKQIPIGDWNNSQIELEGLIGIFKTPLDKRSSLNLWNFMSRISLRWRTSGFQKTKFAGLLNDNKWLFNRFGIRVKPGEVVYSELDETYEYSKELKDGLKFKADEIKNLENTHNGKFLPNEVFNSMVDTIAQLTLENEKLKMLLNPNDSESVSLKLPNLADIIIGTALSESDIVLATENLPPGHQIGITEGSGNSGTAVSYVSTVPTARQKSIGVRGEEFVMKFLRVKYQHDHSIEICDLNESDKLGAGCDIVIKKKGEAIELIEVKATEGGFESRFKLSELQFKTALNSHLNQEEPPYFIYCVYEAGTRSPKHIIINNPVEYILAKKLRISELWFNIRLKSTV